VLISCKMWQHDFGGDTGGLGRARPIQESTLPGINGAGTASGIRPFEPQALLGVSAVVLLVAALAACVPALRASVVDPLIATKSE
jgi:hypothetical protein